MEKHRRMNRKGFAGISFIVGLLVAVICIVFSMALTPVIESSFGMSRGSDAANCPGYVDTSATTALSGNNNNSYNSALETDRITCSILDFTPGMLVLSIVFAVIAGIISGRIASSVEQQQPYYPQYG